MQPEKKSKSSSAVQVHGRPRTRTTNPSGSSQCASRGSRRSRESFLSLESRLSRKSRLSRESRLSRKSLLSRESLLSRPSRESRESRESRDMTALLSSAAGDDAGAAVAGCPLCRYSKTLPPAGCSTGQASFFADATFEHEPPFTQRPPSRNPSPFRTTQVAPIRPHCSPPQPPPNPAMPFEGSCTPNALQPRSPNPSHSRPPPFQYIPFSTTANALQPAPPNLSPASPLQPNPFPSDITRSGNLHQTTFMPMSSNHLHSNPDPPPNPDLHQWCSY